jgi:hypothetical protein
MDEPMMMERVLLWWQRNLGGLYVLIGTVAIGLAALFWYAAGPVSVAWMWGVAHRHEATLHNAAVKLPKGWREHNSVGRSDLHLEKPYKWHARLDAVDMDELSGPDADYQRMLNTLNSLEKVAISNGEVAAVYPLSDANAARFVCLEHGNAEEATLHVTCLERDGRRVVRMVGEENSRQDFAAILTGMAALP